MASWKGKSCMALTIKNYGCKLLGESDETLVNPGSTKAVIVTSIVLVNRNLYGPYDATVSVVSGANTAYLYNGSIPAKSRVALTDLTISNPAQIKARASDQDQISIVVSGLERDL